MRLGCGRTTLRCSAAAWGAVSIAVPQEDGAMLIHSSTQHPSEVLQIVAHALGLRSHDVTVQCRRMGGGLDRGAPGRRGNVDSQFDTASIGSATDRGACAWAAVARRYGAVPPHGGRF